MTIQKIQTNRLPTEHSIPNITNSQAVLSDENRKVIVFGTGWALGIQLKRIINKISR